ncbi:MAG: hypothetical protein FWD22_05255 [Treponema sp.]|nr:hypothetical protein [Treponema sp.]
MKTTTLFRFLMALALLLALPLQGFTQTNQPEVNIYNAEGQVVFSFLLDTPDPDMRRIPASVTSLRQRDPAAFVRLLAEYINENSECDFERVKKAHDWVALNIRYDTQSYFSGRYASQNVDAVIKRGNAVCAGYADVLKYILDVLEIENKVVSGHARGHGSNLWNNSSAMSVNHAWNMVTIYGEKYLIDSTWNAGSLNGTSFRASYKTAYLFANPVVFIHKHFPSYSEDQLLDRPLSAEEFLALPFVRPSFFQAFESWPELARINEVIAGEEINLEFSLKEGYELCYTWYNQSGASLMSRYPAKMSSYKFNVPKLNPGRYKLVIFVKKTGERTYWGCAEYGFIVTAAPKEADV